MARSRDMRNLIQRGDTWHFRGFVPKDLIPVVGKREVHKSLKTSSHAEAVHKRDTARILHREWIEEERRRHERKFLVLDELADEQILDIAREVYAQQWEIALERREEFAEQARATLVMTDVIQKRPGVFINFTNTDSNAFHWMPSHRLYL